MPAVVHQRKTTGREQRHQDNDRDQQPGRNGHGLNRQNPQKNGWSQGVDHLPGGPEIIALDVGLEDEVRFLNHILTDGLVTTKVQGRSKRSLKPLLTLQLTHFGLKNCLGNLSLLLNHNFVEFVEKYYFYLFFIFAKVPNPPCRNRPIPIAGDDGRSLRIKHPHSGIRNYYTDMT